jgi:hypothetical protein
VSPRLLKTTSDAQEFVDLLAPGFLDGNVADVEAVKALLFSFAHRLRPDLNITEDDDGYVTVDPREARA